MGQSSRRAIPQRWTAAFDVATDLDAVLQVMSDEALTLGARHVIACEFARDEDGEMTIKPFRENSPLPLSVVTLATGPDYLPMMIDIYRQGVTFDAASVPPSRYRHVFEDVWRKYRAATDCNDFVAVPLCDAGVLRAYATYVFPERAPAAAAETLTDISYAAFYRGLSLARLAETPLTIRQCESLRLCAGGKHDAEIAEIMGIAQGTAHEHIEEAKRRLGVRTRIEAVVIAARNGWI